MKSVLFLGNSFTFYNDLPGMVNALASAAGEELIVESVTRGGASLREFLNPETGLGQRLIKVSSQTWDVVVFQEQSFRPVGNKDAFFSAANELSSCFSESKRLFYQTWAYRDGTEKLAKTGLTYDSMCKSLRSAYQAAADQNGGMCVPVGDAFALTKALHPQTDLYMPDDCHPSVAGTYLAACLFCSQIIGIPPFDCSDVAGLDAATSKILREEILRNMI